MIEKGKIVTIATNEAYLRQISKYVDIHDADLRDDIDILEKYCSDNEVLAMAAVQIGIPKRIVYLKNTNLEVVNKLQSNEALEEEKVYNEARVLINPVVLTREGITEYYESCASCLDNFALVRRPYKILVRYIDINGKSHEEVFEGFESTVLSHELDHLDGILHMDIAEELFVMEQEDRKKFRLEHDYKIISKTGSYDDLLKKKKLSK